MNELNKLENEKAAVEALISHGKRTGQDMGQWMENLESELAEIKEKIKEVA